MDQSRRAFLKNAALASSALAAAGKLSAQGGANFQRIAAEETFAIPEFLDAIREYVRQDPDREPSPVTPLEDEMANALTDLGAGRLATMDAARIDKQILALWSPGVQIFEAQQGRELATLVNDRLAEAIRERPGRFAGLVTVAAQDPEAAAQEAERGISSLGLNGILINSHTNNEFLDERKYWPILEAAESLDVPIYLHPRIPPDQIYQGVADYNMEGPLWGFGMETSMHVVRLLMSDVFEQFPEPEDRPGTSGRRRPVLAPSTRCDLVHATRNAGYRPPTQRVLHGQLCRRDERHVLGSRVHVRPLGPGSRENHVRRRLPLRSQYARDHLDGCDFRYRMPING